eukprot:UN21899
MFGGNHEQHTDRISEEKINFFLDGICYIRTLVVGGLRMY